MKILHTSDWHLGQNFFTKSRKDEHQAFLSWLLQQVSQHQVNAVIVAGDIFDTGTPPSYAREMYNQFVVQMSQINCTLVVLGGNHDSVSTLNESKQLLACLNTFVVASTADDYSQQLVEISDPYGNTGAILCAIPFIRARDVITSNAGESGLAKRDALGQAIKEHYQQLYQAALDLRQQKNLNVPIIATGHLTALGVSQSDSVRDIYIGTLDGFSADGFPPADYIALGHIHRPQIVAKSEHIRYSGSPIPLSFDELGSDKQVILVEFPVLPVTTENRTQHTPLISPITVPNFQPMAVVKGDLARIEQLLSVYTDGQSAQSTWLCIEVEQDDHLSDLQQRIAALTEGLNVEVLQLRRSRTRMGNALTQQQSETLAELTPAEVFQKRLAAESFEGQQAQQRLARITQEFNLITQAAENPEATE